MTDLPAPAMEMAILSGRLPPPWYLPIEAPACAVRGDVAAEDTNDGIARHFVCDRIAGHVDADHRQVTDNETGTCIVWPVIPGDRR